MKTIPLTQGKVAIVDDEDYERLSKYKWSAQYHHGKWRAIHYGGGKGKGNKITRMHHLIRPIPKGSNLQTDHKNGNDLDNRKSNLRQCTQAENQQNQRVIRRCGTSKYKGVACVKV